MEVLDTKSFAKWAHGLRSLMDEFDSELLPPKDDPGMGVRILSSVDLKSDDRLAIRSDIMEFGWQPLPQTHKQEIRSDHPAFFIAAMAALLMAAISVSVAIFVSLTTP